MTVPVHFSLTVLLRRHWRAVIPLLLLCLGLWAAASHRRRTYTCPWLGTSVPHVRFAGDGIHLAGLDRIRNEGAAPLTGGRWSYYVLTVPATTQDREIKARLKRSDENAIPHDLGNLNPQATTTLTFDSGDPAQLSHASIFQPRTDPLQMNHYLRFLLTYRDAKGATHHTERCYQVVHGVNGTVDVFGCAFGYQSD